VRLRSLEVHNISLRYQDHSRSTLLHDHVKPMLLPVLYRNIMTI